MRRTTRRYAFGVRAAWQTHGRRRARHPVGHAPCGLANEGEQTCMRGPRALHMMRRPDKLSRGGWPEHVDPP
eukprot:712436-Pleurochrysis_carterae.AAC.1